MRVISEETDRTSTFSFFYPKKRGVNKVYDSVDVLSYIQRKNSIDVRWVGRRSRNFEDINILNKILIIF